MPEGPEVRRMAYCINENFAEQHLIEMNFFEGSKVYKDQKLFRSDCDILFNSETNMFTLEIDSKCFHINSHGKKIFFVMEEGMIISSLNMDGKWFLEKPKTIHIELVFENGSLYFYDSGKRANISVVGHDTENMNKFSKELGPDLMDDDTTFEVFCDQLSIKKFSNKPLYEVLTDQSCLAGIGNYLRADILYVSYIQYDRTFLSLDEDEKERLFSSTKEIMFESFESNGLTLRTYIDPSGKQGVYNPKVYGLKETEAGEPVKTIKSKSDQKMYYVDIEDRV